MNAGDSTTIRVTAAVTSSASGPFSNPVSVTGTGVTVDADDSATQSVNLNGTGIDLVAQSLKANPDPVNQGQTLTYTGVVSNNGVQDSGTFTINQTLPPTTDWVQSPLSLQMAASNGFTCTYDSGTNSINCTGDLAPGKSTTITTQILIEPGAALGAITSTLTANPSHAVVESDYTNNAQTTVSTISASPCSSTCVHLTGSDLTATPSTVKPSGTVTYNYAVGNAGTLTAHNVLILITLDTASTGDISGIASATASGTFSCTTFTDPSGHPAAACFDSVSPCSFSPLTEVLTCSGSQTSNIVGKAGVTVSVIADVSGAAAEDDVINSTAAVSQAASDKNFGGTPTMASKTVTVEPDGVADARRGTTSAAHTGALCRRAKPAHHRSGKTAHGKRRTIRCTARHKRHKRHRTRRPPRH
jgi:uncharacterized repeat protein (TIGR01451 family)